MNCGNVFWLTRPVSTSTNAMVEPLSASGRAANTASMAPGPTSFSRATAFCVATPVGSFEDRISVTSRSARKFVKKLIQPFRRGRLLHTSSALANQSQGCKADADLSGAGAALWGSRLTRGTPDPRTAWDYATALTGATVPAPYASHPGIRLVLDMIPEATVNAVRAALEAYLDPYLQDTLGQPQEVREVRPAGAG